MWIIIFVCGGWIFQILRLWALICCCNRLYSSEKAFYKPQIELQTSLHSVADSDIMAVIRSNSDVWVPDYHFLSYLRAAEWDWILPEGTEDFSLWKGVNNIFLKISLGWRNFQRLGLHDRSCMEAFFCFRWIFNILEQVLLSWVGQCCLQYFFVVKQTPKSLHHTVAHKLEARC